MKTKSKRFLNLAALCLALLGTTLLVGRPVKAEARQETVQSIETGSKNEEVSQSSETSGNNLYEDARKKGYEKGYEAGKRPGAPKEPDDDSSINNPYDGFSDGYIAGYSAGWHETHLVESTIDSIFEWFLGVLSYFFGSETV
ncbi:hypothetical protein [Streptococcus pyogenes]|uniref:hypothetical protein n=1 Tax=Streptococcus pyogenes TaxID=1314 RepID=UPI0007C192AF|nr:hypothetical protein [Streptococcus pyogenes]AND04406.1 hypothetical protein AXK13_02250 [Streptococcus pyogenes]QTH62074.1 hypothetical protein J5Z97_02145 [Streptococcus pyogenes]SQF19002.1 hypothetical membrane associated protein [Streptococcus pyogenes]VGT84812.1 hypothetical membrane associated protein [Streptococcus pyogenes]HEP1535893.1 hypothetical protein [Streptococcus pyogenes]